MHRGTANPSRHGRSLAMGLLVLAAVTVCAIAVPQALAYVTYMHGGPGDPTTCASCHTVNTETPPANAACISCHTSYAATGASTTCWTCHNPGQDMSDVGPDAPVLCTDACHLPDDLVGTVAGTPHDPHPERGTCTAAGCHAVSTGPTAPNGSPHHTAQMPPEPITTTVSLKVAPTSIKLKKTVKATGAVTPIADLVGVKVALKAEIKKGSKWVKAKTATATVGDLGTYKWTYKPAKKGTYRITAAIVATDDHKGSTSRTRGFKVK